MPSAEPIRLMSMLSAARAGGSSLTAMTGRNNVLVETSVYYAQISLKELWAPVPGNA